MTELCGVLISVFVKLSDRH